MSPSPYKPHMKGICSARDQPVKRYHLVNCIAPYADRKYESGTIIIAIIIIILGTASCGGPFNRPLGVYNYLPIARICMGVC